MPISDTSRTGLRETIRSLVSSYRAGDEDKYERDKVLLEALRQRMRLEAFSGAAGQTVEEAVPEMDHGGPSVLNRVFDVLQRPNYAIAEHIDEGYRKPAKGLLDSVLEGDFGGVVSSAKDAITAPARSLDDVWEGFSGQKKTTFSDVIKGVGEDVADVTGGEDPFYLNRTLQNKWFQEGTGLALDIGLDPTTYVGVGMVGKVDDISKLSKSEKLKKSAETLGASERVTDGAGNGYRYINNSSVVKGVETQRATKVAKAAEEALKKNPKLSMSGLRGVQEKVLNEALATGGKITPKTLKKAENTELIDNVLETALKAGDEAPRKTLALKIGGVPVADSERLATYADTLGKAFKGTRVGKGLASTFKTTDKFPGLTNVFKREAEGIGVNQLEKFQDSVSATFKGLTKEEKRLITDSIENGTSLTGKIANNGADLGKLQEEALSYSDSLLEAELIQGIHPSVIENGVLKADPDKTLKNYVYHHYRKGDPDAKNAFKKLRNKEQKLGKGEKATVHSLKEAKEKGLDPVEEIDAVLTLRAAKSFPEQTRVRFAKAIQSEFGAQLGTKGKGKTVANKLGLVPAKGKYFDEGVWVPKEVQQAIKNMDDVFASPGKTNELLKLFDDVQNMWKASVTIYNPGHHSKNLVGDMFLNTLDNVSPKAYPKAIKALNENSKRVAKVGNRWLSAEEVRNYYYRHGAKAGFFRSEFSGKGFKATRKIRDFAEAREDFTRMAHFIDVLEKEGKKLGRNVRPTIKQLDDIGREGGIRVRKFNIDYGDLTDVEKKVFKRVAPFYTWMRKNIPLQVEALAMNPGRVAKVPKGLSAMKELFGGDDENFPTIGGINMVPQWIRDMGAVQMIGEGQGRNGVYWRPDVIPTVGPLDMAETVKDAVHEEGIVPGLAKGLSKEGLSQFGLAGAPVELGTGTQVFTGYDIPENNRQYATGYVPGAKFIEKLLDPETDNRIDAVNYLTGAGLTEVTPGRSQGEIRRQQDLLEMAIRNQKDIFLNRILKNAQSFEQTNPLNIYRN